MAYFFRLIFLSLLVISFNSNSAVIYQNCKGPNHNYGDLNSSLLGAGNYWVYFNEYFSPSNANCKEVDAFQCPEGTDYKNDNGNESCVVSQCKDLKGKSFTMGGGVTANAYPSNACDSGCAANKDMVATSEEGITK